MNRDTLETLAAWGDQQNRETAVLLDLAIAGTIDHLAGHGTARLMPARLEELANRIERRYRDPDGAWVVTLRPPEDNLVAVNPYDVLAYCHEIGAPATDAGRHDRVAMIQAAAVPGVTLRDMQDRYPYFVEWVTARYAKAVDNQSG